MWGRSDSASVLSTVIGLLGVIITLAQSKLNQEVSLDLIVPEHDFQMGYYTPQVVVQGMINPKLSSPHMPDTFLRSFRDYFELSTYSPKPESLSNHKCVPTSGSQGLEKAGYCLNNQTIYYVNSGGILNTLKLNQYFDDPCQMWESNPANLTIEGCNITLSEFNLRIQQSYLVVFFYKYTELNHTKFLRVIWMTKASFTLIGAYSVELKPEYWRAPLRVFVTSLYPAMPNQRQATLAISFQSKENSLQILQGDFPTIKPTPYFCNTTADQFTNKPNFILDCGLPIDLNCTFTQVSYDAENDQICFGICTVNASNPDKLTYTCEGSDNVRTSTTQPTNTSSLLVRSMFRMSLTQEFTLMHYQIARDKIEVHQIELAGVMNAKYQFDTFTLIEGYYLRNMPSLELDELDITLLDSKSMFGVLIRSPDQALVVLQSRVTKAVFLTVQPHSKSDPANTIIFGDNIIVSGAKNNAWTALEGEIEYIVGSDQKKNDTLIRKIVVQSEFDNKRIFFTLRVRFHESFFSCIQLSESFSATIYVGSGQFIKMPEYTFIGNDLKANKIELYQERPDHRYSMTISPQNQLTATFECELSGDPDSVELCGYSSGGILKYRDGYLLETFTNPSQENPGTEIVRMRIYKCQKNQAAIKRSIGYLLLCKLYVDLNQELAAGTTPVGFYPFPRLSIFIVVCSGISPISDPRSSLIAITKKASSSNSDAIVEEIPGTIFTHQLMDVRHLLPTSSSEEFSLMLIFSAFTENAGVQTYKLFTKIYLIYALTSHVKSLQHEKVTEFKEKFEFFCPIGSFSGISSKVVYIISHCITPNSGSKIQLLETKLVGEKLNFVKSFPPIIRPGIEEPLHFCYVDDILITITSSSFSAWERANLKNNIQFPVYEPIWKIKGYYCFEEVGIFALWVSHPLGNNMLYIYKTKFASIGMDTLFRTIEIDDNYVDVFLNEKGLLIATKSSDKPISFILLETDHLSIYAHAVLSKDAQPDFTPEKLSYVVTVGNQRSSQRLRLDVTLDKDVGVTKLSQRFSGSYPNSTHNGYLPATNHRFNINELFELKGCLISPKIIDSSSDSRCHNYFQLENDTFKENYCLVQNKTFDRYLVEQIRVEQQIKTVQVVVQDAERFKLLVFTLNQESRFLRYPLEFLLDYGGSGPYLYVMEREKKGILFWQGEEDNSLVLYAHIIRDFTTFRFDEPVRSKNSFSLLDGIYDSIKIIGRAHSLSFIVKACQPSETVSIHRLYFNENLTEYNNFKLVEIPHGRVICLTKLTGRIRLGLIARPSCCTPHTKVLTVLNSSSSGSPE